MNLVGKILVVLLFVASVFFLGFAVVVVATHKNWREAVERPRNEAGPDKPLGLKIRLEDQYTLRDQLVAERTRLQNEFARNKAAWEQRQGQLESRLAELQKQRDELQKDQDDVNQQWRDANARMLAAEQRLETNQTELERLREENRQARLKRDQEMAKVVQLEDQLAQATGEWQRLKKREVQLMEQNSELMLALQNNGIHPGEDKPRVEGIVLASADNGYVELSVGFDDGLEKQDTLEVYRLGATPQTSKYLGRVRVVRTSKNKSIAQVIPELLKGKIQRNDRVATRLN